ncbi:NACHT domain-containing protein (plasmid) [Bradyrhizobium sp. vgs-9]|uniref:NACHT domain-containing protein n=1 Tax=Bradyrhizobium sp. vgs-9 TaxID=208389 RepID=UPI0035D44331
MSIPLDHRVADVRVSLPDGRERRGTGFLVSPGRILTALHVTTGEAALHQPTLGPVAATIEVRLIGDLVREGGSAHVDPKRAAAEMAERSRKSWRSVKLIWPEVGDPIPRFEVALLEFTEFSSTGPLAFVVPPLVGAAEDGTPIRALGFPRWSELDAGDVGKLLEPHVVHVAAKPAPQLYSPFTEAKVLSGAPIDDKFAGTGWEGLSGSVTFDDEGRLVGIVSSAKRSSGNDVLKLTLMSNVLDGGADIAGFAKLSGLWDPSRIAARTWPVPLALPSNRDADLEQFVQYVRANWISGVLSESLDGDKPLPIRGHFEQKDADLDALGSGSLGADLPEIDPVAAFLDSGRALFIRGRAGVGKSHALMRIAEFLCWRYEVGRPASEPAPAIFLLKTWRPRSQDLVDWIHGELERSNRIRRDVSERWLLEGRVTLLFDGLDEIDEAERAEALKGINHFLEEFPEPDLVICGRTGAIQEVPRLGALLAIDTFHAQDVRDHAEKVSATLGRHLEDSAILLKLARSPLMLRFLMRSYQIAGEDPLSNIPEDPAELRGRTFRLYIEAMLAGARSSDRYVPEKRFLARLSSLAKILSDNRQTIFQIERVQPNVLRAATLIASYAFLSRFVPIVMMGLLTGVAAGTGMPLGAALGKFPAWPVSQRLPVDVEKSLAIAAVTGLIVGIFEAYRLWRRRPRPREEKKFVIGYSATLVLFTVSSSYLVGERMGLLKGTDSALLFPLAIGIFFGTCASTPVYSNDIPLGQFLHFSSKRAAKGLAWGLFVGTAIFLVNYLDRHELAYSGIYLAIIAMLGASWAGIRNRRPTSDELKKLGPGLWLRNALKSFLIFGGAVTGAVFFLGVVDWLVRGTMIFDAGIWLRAAVTKGLVIGAGAFFVYGAFDFGKHACLRLLLKFAGILPLRLRPLLRSAEALNLMMRVGNGSIFVHGELQAYLAALRRPLS